MNRGAIVIIATLLGCGHATPPPAAPEPEPDVVAHGVAYEPPCAYAFKGGKLDDALAAYQAQLIAVGYLPEGVPPPPPRDPNGLVVMNLDDLLGSSEPSDAAGQVLYRTRPTDAWVAFAAHGAPALAAGGDGLNVIGPKGLATHPWSQSNQAIVAFRALVK